MTESAHPHRIYLLGGLRAEAPGGPVAVPGGKPQALLAYLILHPHTPHTREQLMENFWPDVPAERAGRYLSNALYRLRASLGGEWLQVEEERLGVQRDSVWVDVWEFERLAKSARAADWEQALALYAGDLLPEIYADWILLPRLSLRERFLAVLGQAAEQCATDGRWPEAAGHLRRLVAADPLNENAHRNLMHALARLGRVAEALRSFDELRARLHRSRREHGVPRVSAAGDPVTCALPMLPRCGVTGPEPRLSIIPALRSICKCASRSLARAGWAATSAGGWRRRASR